MAFLSHRSALVLGTVLVLAAGTGIIFSAVQRSDDPQPGVAGASTPAETSVSTPAPDTDASAPPATDGARPPAADLPPDPAAPGAGGDQLPAETGLEIPPTAPEDAAEPALPVSDPLEALMPGPPPATDSETGAVVAGFPAFIEPAPRSTVDSSMVTSEGDRVQAALTASSADSADLVRTHFDTVFAGHNLQPTIAPAVGGSTALAYTRGSESVTVTLTPQAAGGCRYSVLANLDASG